MQNKRNNDWSNTDTHHVYLHIRNEMKRKAYWRQAVKQAFRSVDLRKELRLGVRTIQEAAKSHLAEQLKYEVLETSPNLGNTIHARLLETVIHSVNWYEIADRLLDESYR